jgi:histidinol-phosphate aminotransferase
VAERDRLGQRLAELGWLRTLPSRANFLLCGVRGIAAGEVWGRLREKGVLVRHFDTPALRGWLRISVGKAEDTDRLLEALAEIGEGVGK